MKRFVSILLALVLLAACGRSGQAPAPGGDSSPGGPVVFQPEEGDGGSGETPETPGSPDGENAVPQADVALIREIIFTYGAQVDDANNRPDVIVVKNKSAFIWEESWSGENGLDPYHYLLWEDSLRPSEEEWAAIEAGQHYAEGRQGKSSFGYRYLGPGETVEEKILSHFQVTLEHLRSDPEYYDGSIPGYFMMAGGGVGEKPTVSFTYQQDGDILTIPVILTPPDNSTSPEKIHILTVRLEPGGGWKYLGCQVSAAQ